MKRVLALTLAFIAIWFAVQPLMAIAQETEEETREPPCELTPDQQRAFIDANVPKYDCEEPANPPPTVGGSSGPLSGCDNAERVWNFFTDPARGLLPHQAAGIMGNMQAEAHFEPRLVEYGWRNSRGEISVAGEPSSLDENMPPTQGPDGQPGYGIIQWTSIGRKQGLIALAQSRNMIVGDLGLQLDYLWQEINSPPYNTNTLAPLRNASNSDQASEIVTRNYEIPGNMASAIPERQGFALEILTRFTTGGGCG